MSRMKHTARSGLFSHGLWPGDDIPLSDVESLNPPAQSTTLTGSTPASRTNPTNFLRTSRRKLHAYESAQEDMSGRAQDSNAPLFIPTFTSLRRTIVEHLTDSLQRLEREIAIERSTENVSSAITLLRQMGGSSIKYAARHITGIDIDMTDHVIESDLRLARLENPVHADSQGLTVLHFDKKDRTQYQPRPEPWLMVTKKWGPQSQTIVEYVDNAGLKRLLPDHCRESLNTHVDISNASEPRSWIVRTKTAAESQKWTLRYDGDGKIRYRPRARRAWQATFAITIVALVCFYGVGIIATNTTFNDNFKKYFFWIAIFWSLISSSLLAWLTMAFGASHRDAAGAFLTGIGIWLVVIQTGQTHLITQLQSNSNEGQSNT